MMVDLYEKATARPWALESLQEAMRLLLERMIADGRGGASLAAAIMDGQHEDDGSLAAYAVNNIEAREARISQLEAALEKSREGWASAIELGLLPPQHIAAATILRDDAEAALQNAGGLE